MKRSMIGFVVMAVCTAVWLLVDGYFNFTCSDGDRCTISYLLFWESYHHPVIPFLFGLIPGILLGHMFFTADIQEPEQNKPPI